MDEDDTNMFLFHTGSIKSVEVPADAPRLEGVSIPYWFD